MKVKVMFYQTKLVVIFPFHFEIALGDILEYLILFVEKWGKLTWNYKLSVIWFGLPCPCLFVENIRENWCADIGWGRKVNMVFHWAAFDFAKLIHEGGVSEIISSALL